MYKLGVCVGKYSPPHRGHIGAILNAATQCEKLIVVVSHHPIEEEAMYASAGMKPIPMFKRARWLALELSEVENITIKMLDETGIPVYPDGWELWSHRLQDLIGEPISAIFGGEENYDQGYTKYFPDTEYVLYDKGRNIVPISSTRIRRDVYKHWDYLINSAKPHFTKKVLITGTESCAKTSTIIKLAKIYNTSWSREEGRH
jgi:HTH-type transcriptional repressor of NAD biosynthesis genes